MCERVEEGCGTEVVGPVAGAVAVVAGAGGARSGGVLW